MTLTCILVDRVHHGSGWEGGDGNLDHLHLRLWGLAGLLCQAGFGFALQVYRQLREAGQEEAQKEGRQKGQEEDYMTKNL